MKTYTPGPYHIKKRTKSGEFVTDTVICSMNESVLANLHCNSEGNAALFAAAPELLDCLRMLEKELDTWHNWQLDTNLNYPESTGAAFTRDVLLKAKALLDRLAS